ncbi:Dyp-type peroxidase [Actinoplanes sp. NPDC051859]|uniref:Dyp-type peroxidase n=1 Tax=Actinoplanes sp. NPDC051859 TaxID=3363909 RepID=UPI0037B39465
MSLSRRTLLAGGTVAGLSAAAGAAVGAAASGQTPDVAAAGRMPEAAVFGTETVPFHGPRQAGVTTEPPAQGTFVAFTLKPGTDRRALGRMMRMLSDDAARLTRGEPALGDTDATLAGLPSRLTITFGFGPGLYKAAGLEDKRPPSVQDLPSFRIDRLLPRWSGGDLVLQICADDPMTVTHTQRMLIKDARPFADVRWVQRGFRNTPGVQPAGFTQRNVLGQLDGTANPLGPEMDTAVWAPDNSTQLVVRRVRAEIETWDLLSTTDKEAAVGRRMDTGAPLSGKLERDEPDFAALDPAGLPLIPDFSHMTRARVTDPKLKILRRPYNYDDAPDATGRPDSGLIFASYQADIALQFLPIQRRLAEKDLLNQWITPIGSAVFAVPPGCAADGWIGDQLLG